MQTLRTCDVYSSPLRATPSQAAICHSQETIYQYFLTDLATQTATEALEAFTKLFIEYTPQPSSQKAYQALSQILGANQESQFRQMLKRVFFILINQWETSREAKLTDEFIKLFKKTPSQCTLTHPQCTRLALWLKNFSASQDYQEIQLHVSEFEETDQPSWVQRYRTYFLVRQALDLNNSVEQRHAARVRAKALKDQFKFTLALYTARTQSSPLHAEKARNPTRLSDNLLELTRKSLVRRGQFSYANLAHIFLEETQNQTYQEFKQSLKKYLTFGMDSPEVTHLIHSRLFSKIDALYRIQNSQPLKENLRLLTCNRLIDCLIMEDKHQPSDLFVQFISRGNPFQFVLIFVKIILICPSAKVYLERRISNLLEYYCELPEERGEWLVNFLEILNVALAIYV